MTALALSPIDLPAPQEVPAHVPAVFGAGFFLVHLPSHNPVCSHVCRGGVRNQVEDDTHDGLLLEVEELVPREEIIPVDHDTSSRPVSLDSAH